MADLNDRFFLGEDFDAVLGILEAEEDVEERFQEAVNEVSTNDQASSSMYLLSLSCVLQWNPALRPPR